MPGIPTPWKKLSAPHIQPSDLPLMIHEIDMYSQVTKHHENINMFENE